MAIVLKILKAIVRWTWKIWAGFCGIASAAALLGIEAKWIHADDYKVTFSGPFEVLNKLNE